MADDLYAAVTATMIEQLREGVRPWQIPWNRGDGAVVMRPLRHSGEPYSGANVLTLWMAAHQRGYSSPYWLTYKQAQVLGGQVRRGERSVGIVRVRRIEKTEVDPETGQERERRVAIARRYPVFNAEQIDGLPSSRLRSPQIHDLQLDERIETVERFVAATEADIRHGGIRAYYAIAEDRIHMPDRERFEDTERYCATLCHELVHWTGASTRLDRKFGEIRDGATAYAREELVAEIGSAFLAADLGITPTVREDHAAYVQGWLEVLENNTRAIFQAASQAQRAVTWLHGFSQHRNLAEDMPVADVPRRLDEAGPSARPMYDIECGGAVVERDRISWREPVWRENPGGERLGGRCVIQGIVEASMDRNRVQVQITAAVGDGGPKAGDIIERSRDLFVGYGCRRARWNDEGERAVRLQATGVAEGRDGMRERPLAAGRGGGLGV